MKNGGFLKTSFIWPIFQIMLIDSNNFMKFSRKIRSFLLLPLFLILLNCEALKPKKVSKDTPLNAQERARKNVKEGRGISIGNVIGRGRGGTSYEFSSSNPMWRASLETLDFLPLTTVDYSGGVIISDWYNDSSNKNNSIKVTVRFLSNEIQSNSIKVIVHKKACDVNNNCRINIIDSKIKEELVKAILTRAAVFEKEKKKKK